MKFASSALAVFAAALAMTTRASPTTSGSHGPPSINKTSSLPPRMYMKFESPVIPADVKAMREQYAHNKYLEYLRYLNGSSKADPKSKPQSRGRLDKRDNQPSQIECDNMDAFKELPFSLLQAGLADQCNNLDNIFNNRVPGVNINFQLSFGMEIEIVARGPTYIRYQISSDGSQAATWTERDNFNENTSGDPLPYRTREDAARKVGWWFQKSVWEKFEWNDCFDDYWNIAWKCEGPGKNFWGSTGGDNHVETKESQPWDRRYRHFALHVTP